MINLHENRQTNENKLYVLGVTKLKVTLRKKKLRSGDHSLYLDYYQKGERQFEFLGLRLTGNKVSDKDIMALAEKIRTQRQDEVNHEEYGFLNKKKSIVFLDYYEKVRSSKSTQSGTWKHTLYHLKIYLAGKNPLIHQIDSTWIEEFKSYLLVQISANTARTYFSVLLQVFRKAIQEGIISKNPCLNINNIKAHDTMKAYLDYDEIKKLSETACGDPEVKRAYLFGCYTGLRLSDIRALKWKNIKGDKIEVTMKKTKEPVYLPIHEVAKKIMGERKEEEDSIFNIPSQTQLGMIMKTWIAQAGIQKRITFHSSRHTFATLSLTSGADIYTVSKLLGHSRLETTQVYAKIIDRKKQEAVDLLPSIEV
jgi:integrase